MKSQDELHAGDSGLSVSEVNKGRLKEISCVRDEFSFPRLSRKYGEKDVGSSNRQMSSLLRPLANGDLVAPRKRECRRPVDIEKASSDY